MKKMSAKCVKRVLLNVQHMITRDTLAVSVHLGKRDQAGISIIKPIKSLDHDESLRFKRLVPIASLRISRLSDMDVW